MPPRRGRPGKTAVVAAIACATAVAASATAQNDAAFRRSIERRLQEIDSTYRLTVPPDQPIAERLQLEFGGSARFGLVTSDNSASVTRVLRQSDATFHARAELDGAHRFFGRLRLLYNDFNSGDSFDGRGDELEEPIGDRYWYEFDSAGAEIARTGERPDTTVNIKGGRQYVLWGSGLALSNVLYAGLVDVGIGDIGLIGLAAATPPTGTIDFDGTRPGFDEDTRRNFFGGRIELRGMARHVPSVSFLAQRDENDLNTRIFPTPFGPILSVSKYDSDYYTAASRGNLTESSFYRVELIHQRGRARSSSVDPTNGLPTPQTTESIDAWAGMLTLIQLFRNEADTRLEVEFAGGSGDADRGHPSNTFLGNRSGTKDQAFNALGYINTGLALSPEISNLLMLRVGVRHTVFDRRRGAGRLRAGLDGFLLAKAHPDAPLSVTTLPAHFVGGEIDVSIDWRAAADLEINLRYGVFVPGEAIPDGQDDLRHFFYLGAVCAF